MKYDTILFDIDGVLIDVRNSFMAAVIQAVQYGSGRSGFGPTEVAILKSIRGFNNDWHVAIAGGLWATRFTEIPFTQFADRLEAMGGGIVALRRVANGQLDQTTEQYYTRLAQEAYGGITACRRLYGFAPATLKSPGAWQNEVPLLSADRLAALKAELAIVTGRNRTETELAFEILGWSLDWERVALSDDPVLDKPAPGKALKILTALQSKQALMVGDSRDDLELVSNLNSAGTIRVDFCCIAEQIPAWAAAYPVFSNVNLMLKELIDHDEIR